jgi:hypothetical protein
MASRIEMESRKAQEMQNLAVSESRSRVKGSFNQEKPSGKETKIKLEISPKLIKNIIPRVEKR